MSGLPEANTVVLTILAVTTLINTLMANSRGKKAEAAVVEVKDTLAISGQATERRLDDIHKLVNSEYAISLRVGAAALERIAAITKDPHDIQQARAARQMSKDHDAKQSSIDKEKENK